MFKRVVPSPHELQINLLIHLRVILLDRCRYANNVKRYTVYDVQYNVQCNAIQYIRILVTLNVVVYKSLYESKY